MTVCIHGYYHNLIEAGRFIGSHLHDFYQDRWKVSVPHSRGGLVAICNFDALFNDNIYWLSKSGTVGWDTGKKPATGFFWYQESRCPASMILDGNPLFLKAITFRLAPGFTGGALFHEVFQWVWLTGLSLAVFIFKHSVFYPSLLAIFCQKFKRLAWKSGL